MLAERDGYWVEGWMLAERGGYWVEGWMLAERVAIRWSGGI